MKKKYLIILVFFIYNFSNSQSVYMVADIQPGEFGTYPYRFYGFTNQLVFDASATGHFNELFIYDGINEPFYYDLWEYGASSPDNFVSLNNNLYFTTSKPQGTYAQYVYTGEDEPVLLWTDTLLTDPIIYNNKIYFGNNQLGVFDGINPPEIITNFADLYIEFKFILDNKLYLCAYNDASGPNFWLFNGINNIVQVSNITDDMTEIMPKKSICNNKLFFTGSRNTAQFGYEYELWYFDGTNNPIMVDVFPGTYTFWDPGTGQYVEYLNSSDVDKIKTFNNNIYFQAHNETGSGLFVYDFISDPHFCSDLYFEENSYNYIDFFEVYNNSLYFRASNDGVNFGLWKYDGVNPPIQICEIDQILSLTKVNNKLYFSANDQIHGYELWCYQEPLNIDNPGNNEGKITLFPNPCKNQLNIVLTNSNINNYILQIYNIQGVCIYNSGMLSNTKNSIIINTSDFNDGIYFLKIITKQNIINQTFIVSN
jgi:hypothetical protein